MTQFERTFNVIKKPWFVFSYVILVFLAYNFADKSIASYCYQLDLRGHAHILRALTLFGQWIIYLLLFALMGLYFRYIKPNTLNEARAWFLLACVLLTNMVGFALKISLSRARPDLLFDGNFFGFYFFRFNDLYWSFPSGHSITVTALASGLGVLFPRYFYALLSFAFLVILTRVFLYFHYLSDVMAGVYLSLLVVGFFVLSLKKTRCLAQVV